MPCILGSQRKGFGAGLFLRPSDECLSETSTHITKHFRPHRQCESSMLVRCIEDQDVLLFTLVDGHAFTQEWLSRGWSQLMPPSPGLRSAVPLHGVWLKLESRASCAQHKHTLRVTNSAYETVDI